ncbi:MAG: hypothetical protein ACSHX6_11905 [Akkermansiaceae bacterium]
MDTETEPNSTSQASPPSPNKRYVGAKNSRKKKVAVFIIAAGASAFGTLAYLNKSADPTTWESMRTDYKNTK